MLIYLVYGYYSPSWLAVPIKIATYQTWLKVHHSISESDENSLLWVCWGLEPLDLGITCAPDGFRHTRWQYIWWESVQPKGVQQYLFQCVRYCSAIPCISTSSHVEHSRISMERNHRRKTRSSREWTLLWALCPADYRHSNTSLPVLSFIHSVCYCASLLSMLDIISPQSHRVDW